MKKFSDLGLAERVLDAVSAEGYTEPTPIQVQAIPAMLQGRDIVGIAQTGTGKTAAFVLPLLDQIARGHERPGPRTCRTLILAPTRELAAQINDSIRTYGRFVRHSSAVVVGGVKPGPQIRAMAQGLDILVATPGRLEDHVQSGKLSLSETTTIVLDEGDQMMDLGFMPAIRRIMKKLPKSRRTVLFSATMPKQIRSLANDFLKSPVEISVAPTARPIEKIDQQVFLVARPQKRRVLTDYLKSSGFERVIIFTRTKRGADKVALNLGKDGLSAAAIHGNKSQNQRERALASFKKGNISILVATDIAARGIDIDGVSHVINFELPNIAESYVHRIGRTARAGKSGIAISLCDPSEREHVRDIEKLIGATIKKENMGVSDGADFDLTDPRDAEPRPARAPGKKHHHRQGQGQRRRGGKPRAANDGQNREGQNPDGQNRQRNRRRRKPKAA